MTLHRVAIGVGTVAAAAVLGFAALPTEGEDVRVGVEQPVAEDAAGDATPEGLEGPRGGEILTLETESPEEGFQLAIDLARKGVTETQPDPEVLHALRPEYSEDFDALIASSHVVAVHFRTVAEANDYWR